MNLWMHDLKHFTLTKAELGEQLADQMGLSLRAARDLVDGFFGILIESLGKRDAVKLSNFGTFRVHNKAARPGRNVRTQQDVTVRARRTVTFAAGPKLRSRLNPGVRRTLRVRTQTYASKRHDPIGSDLHA